MLRQNRAYQTIDTNKAGVRFRSPALRLLNDEYVQAGYVSFVLNFIYLMWCLVEEVH